GDLTIERYESAICDMALQAPVDPETAHPMWFIIASLRSIGITVDELCALARMGREDALLFGECTVEQVRPLAIGDHYHATATITDVAAKTMRDGARLDTVAVRVDVAGAEPVGSVISSYLFKRAAI
ncbi:MAG TPA: hypothetical protein VIQ11_06810, partial [Mycobacterium sp.]